MSRRLVSRVFCTLLLFATTSCCGFHHFFDNCGHGHAPHHHPPARCR